MDKLIIEGPAKLEGSVSISRSKNAYLPILAATILNPNPIHLKDLPDLRDIRTMLKLLEKLGVQVKRSGSITTIDASNMTSREATYDLVKTMRASIFVLGPLLGRFQEGKVSLPGGCAIGPRPINIHLENLEKMGAEFNLDGGVVSGSAKELKGTHLPLSFPSVGATENLLCAAVLATGETIIENAALEPEVGDLINFLNKMGANIKGIGTHRLVINGVKQLNGIEYTAISDRIEAATYVMAGLITQSTINITDVQTEHLEFVLDSLKKMNADISWDDSSIQIKPSDLQGIKIDTAPYPGLPTDVQAQLMALMTQAKGTSIITENIFENRFMHVPELKRLGAKITQKGKSCIIEGQSPLKGAPIMCTDLRASAALVLAALVSTGETEIHRIYHLERGYEKLEEKLKTLGLNVRKAKAEII
jgi:UDP-N-acetylglucosamine 1-carboxyvinyltransferase